MGAQGVCASEVCSVYHMPKSNQEKIDECRENIEKLAEEIEKLEAKGANVANVGTDKQTTDDKDLSNKQQSVRQNSEKLAKFEQIKKDESDKQASFTTVKDLADKYKTDPEYTAAKVMEKGAKKSHNSGGSVYNLTLPEKNFRLVWHDHDVKDGRGANRMEIEQKFGSAWGHRDCFSDWPQKGALAAWS